MENQKRQTTDDGRRTTKRSLVVSRWSLVISVLLIGLIGAGMMISGCGKTASESGAGAGGSGGGGGGTSTLSIEGTVAASQSDLAALGSSVTSLSTLSTESSALDLTARGITPSSVKAAGLVPMTVSDLNVTVVTVNKDGSGTKVADGTFKKEDSSYKATIDNYDASKTYQVVCSKTSTETNKTLEMKSILPAPSKTSTGFVIKGTDAEVTPQTSLIAQMIIEKVVKVLESANIDPKIVANVKDAITSAVNSLITSGVLGGVTAVRDAKATDNTAMNQAADKAAANSTIADKLDSIENSTRITMGAEDLESAKGAIREILMSLFGSPDIPEEFINGLAQSYVDGLTKTTADMTNALNNALYDRTSKQAVAGSFTTSQIATEIQNMIRGTYMEVKEIPEGVKSVVETLFPKEEWNSKTIEATTSFTVPQCILLVGLGEHLAETVNLGFNHAKVAQALGLMKGIEDKIQITHGELRIISFEDWQNVQPGEKPKATNVLASWADVGSFTNPDPNATAGYICYLTYPTANGTKTVPYQERKDKEMHEDGPPPGWKVFSIEPWDMQSGNRISDFIPGMATITAKDASGKVVDTKEEEILNVDLSKAEIEIKIPKEGWIDQALDLSTFPENTKPTFKWMLKSIGTTVPDGHRLGYVINVRKGEFKQEGDHVNFFVNWGDLNSRIFDSWDKQEFPTASVGSETNWAVPTALAEGFYEFGITVVMINRKTNYPIIEGPHRGGIFIVGEPTIPDQFKEQYKEQYNTDFTAPQEKDISKEEFILTGKVHEELLKRFSGANVKVGLYNERYDPSKGFKMSPVSGVDPVSLSSVSGQTYKTFELKFKGDVFGTNYGQYVLLLFKDSNGNGVKDDGEDHERSQKGIEHQNWGTEAHWPDGGGSLLDNKINFNFIYWGDSF